LLRVVERRWLVDPDEDIVIFATVGSGGVETSGGPCPHASARGAVRIDLRTRLPRQWGRRLRVFSDLWLRGSGRLARAALGRARETASSGTLRVVLGAALTDSDDSAACKISELRPGDVGPA
jgi:hypothetical protein